jgi:hypothetical protein
MDDLELTTWKRGIAIGPRDRPDRRLYLWFYEWHMFDAVERGLHTHAPGSLDDLFDRAVSDDGTRATVDGSGVTLDAAVRDDGADLSLTVDNETERDWPGLASVVPCLNPGQTDDGTPASGCFADDDHRHSYYLGESGLERLDEREIHFLAPYREAVTDREPDEGFPWAEKWPTADRDAAAPLLVRAADQGGLAGGIAWEDSISAQGHNPWNCLHLSVKVGPLSAGESRTIDGALYLVEGDADAVRTRYEREFDFSPSVV